MFTIMKFIIIIFFGILYVTNSEQTHCIQGHIIQLLYNVIITKKSSNLKREKNNNIMKDLYKKMFKIQNLTEEKV